MKPCRSRSAAILRKVTLREADLCVVEMASPAVGFLDEEEAPTSTCSQKETSRGGSTSAVRNRSPSTTGPLNEPSVKIEAALKTPFLRADVLRMLKAILHVAGGTPPQSGLLTKNETSPAVKTTIPAKSPRAIQTTAGLPVVRLPSEMNRGTDEDARSVFLKYFGRNPWTKLYSGMLELLTGKSKDLAAIDSGGKFARREVPNPVAAYDGRLYTLSDVSPGFDTVRLVRRILEAEQLANQKLIQVARARGNEPADRPSMDDPLHANEKMKGDPNGTEQF